MRNREIFAVPRNITLCVTLVCLSVGCGKQIYPVRGHVKFADEERPTKELAGYLVTFESAADTVSATSLISAEGTFEMSTYSQSDGVIPGKHRVAITAPIQTGDGPAVRWLIDRGYGAFDTSGLTLDVNAPMSDVVFRVERIGNKVEDQKPN